VITGDKSKQLTKTGLTDITISDIQELPVHDNPPKPNSNNNKEPWKFHEENNGVFGILPPIKTEDTTHPNQKQKNNSSSDKLLSITISHLETLIKKVDQLQKDVDMIKDKNQVSNKNDYLLETILSRLPSIYDLRGKQESVIPSVTHDDSFDILDKIIAIQSSPSNKKSLSINSELEKEIKRLISQKYGITDCDSKIINTALMIALLKVVK
jgi:hypothetical protein